MGSRRHVDLSGFSQGNTALDPDAWQEESEFGTLPRRPLSLRCHNGCRHGVCVRADREMAVAVEEAPNSSKIFWLVRQLIWL